MRVLFVTSMHPTRRFPRTGKIIARMAAALRHRGHQIDMCELGEGSPVRYVMMRGRVGGEIRRLHPDIIHVHFGYSGIAVPRTSVPIVTSYYGDDLNGTWTQRGGLTLKSKVGVMVSQWVASRSRRCIVVSAAMVGRLWRASDRKKTRTIRDAVETSLFRPLPRIQARSRLNLPDDAAVVLFPHEASQATKRLWLAEAAVATLRRKRLNARLWVVNDVEPDEMPWVYAAADVMIITSAREGGPSSAKEALACGLPVVSVPVGDVELFAETRGRTFLAEETAEALADALDAAIDVGRGQLRQNFLPEHLTLSSAAKRIEEVYLECMG